MLFNVFSSSIHFLLIEICLKEKSSQWDDSVYQQMCELAMSCPFGLILARSLTEYLYRKLLTPIIKLEPLASLNDVNVIFFIRAGDQNFVNFL